MGTHELEQLLHQYGLGLVFAVVALQALGAPLPGTTALVLAALYAGTTHGLSIVGVIAAGAVGAIAGTCGGFVIGRWRGKRLMLFAGRRMRQSPQTVERIRAEFAANSTAVLFVGRFITGVRNITGLVAGASGLSFARFLPIVSAAAAVWATVNALEYYWFGHALQSADTWLQVVLIAAGLAWLGFSFRFLRRRTLHRLEGVTSDAE